MVTLTGNNIYLRALEPEDIDILFAVENNENLWEVSATQVPYSRFLLQRYLENAKQDIYEAKQLRLAICKKDATFLGTIDLYDFDPKNLRAGIGILIHEPSERSKGNGMEALQLIISYAGEYLHLHQVYATIGTDNLASIQLFEKLKFQKIGVKKDWNRVGDQFKDELLYQFIYVH